MGVKDELRKERRELMKTSNLASFTLYARIYMRSRFTNSACNVLPSEAGLRSTITPAASSAAILESAPPLPPLTIAPAELKLN